MNVDISVADNCSDSQSKKCGSSQSTVLLGGLNAINLDLLSVEVMELLDSKPLQIVIIIRAAVAQAASSVN